MQHATLRPREVQVLRYDASSEQKAWLIRLHGWIQPMLNSRGDSYLMYFESTKGWRPLGEGQWIVREELPGWSHARRKAHPPVRATADTMGTAVCTVCEEMLYHEVHVRVLDDDTFALSYDLQG